VAGAAPAPLAEGVPDLVERMRGLGMTVDLRVSGRTLALSDARQVAVYRIVQESLTNALKHAGPDARVTVGIEAASRGVSLNVTSEGEDPLVARGDPGAGIDGMKERARLAGGWLRAAPTGRDGRGGFVVTAFVPVGGGGAVHV
jgi:signal transduction histidine kinase